MHLPKSTSNDDTERSLASFAYRMRQQYEKGKLSSEHIKILEEIPGWSWEIKRPIQPNINFSDIIFQDDKSDVEMAKTISQMIDNNKLSPIYFTANRHNFESKRLILFREQYKQGCLSKTIEDILLNVAKQWAWHTTVCEEDILHDNKFDDYLCYNKLPYDVYYRCYSGMSLAKEWHKKYLKRKLDIFDSKIPGEIFEFESELFNLKFINLLRNYFNTDIHG